MATPNRYGVYPKSAAETTSVRSSRTKIDLYLLETNQGWLAASDYQNGSGRFLSPLSNRHPHYPSRLDAARAEVRKLRRVGAGPRLLNQLWQAIEQNAQLELDLPA